MPRYTKGKASAPRADWFDSDDPFLPSLTVDDHEAVDTGLATGEPIMRAPNSIGFHADIE